MKNKKGKERITYEKAVCCGKEFRLTWEGDELISTFDLWSEGDSLIDYEGEPFCSSCANLAERERIKNG